MIQPLMQKVPPLPIVLACALLYACSPAYTTMTPSPPATLVSTATPASMSCTLLHVPATPEALGAEFGDLGHIAGPANAPVTIVVFSDYQCPACAFLAASLKQVRITHTTDVRLIYINIPISGRDKDALTIQAVEAADLQGKYWEMHDLLFEKQTEWSSLAPADFKAWVVRQATGLGMDQARFQTDFDGEIVAGRLQRATLSSTSQAITPPILFVNSTSRYTGLADFTSLDSVVRMEAIAARQFGSCPPWVIDPLKQYIATLHTAKGDVQIQLYPDKAPMAVNDFVFLARSSWYNGVTFYEMVPDLLVMTGDPSDTGMGNPGYLFKTEITAGLSFDQPGIVAMDNSGPDTNGSRFFITLAPAKQKNGQYTVIGKVLSGLNVLSALIPRNPQPGVYLPPGDKLFNISIQER